MVNVPTFKGFDQALMEAEAFELEKAAKKKELQGSGLPFEGNSFDAQIANEAYRFNLEKGMQPDEAKRSAIDTVLGTKSRVMTDISGNLVSIPRPPVFGNVGQPQMQKEVDTNLPGSLGLSSLPIEGEQAPLQVAPMDYSSLQVGDTLPMPAKPSPNLSRKTQQVLQEETVKSDVKRRDELTASANAASAAKQAAENMANLSGRLGYTGIGGGTVGLVDKALTGIGKGDLIKGDPAAREVFQSEGVNAWVRAVEPLKGALTEREGARFDRAIPSLSTTPEGIKLLTDITIKMGQRAQEKSRFYQDWLQQNGSLAGADEMWSDYSEKNPVIPEELLSGGSANPSTAKKRGVFNPKTGKIEWQ